MAETGTRMLTYYVKIDPDTGYIQSIPQTEKADELTEIFILPIDDERDFFLKNWSHYYLTGNGSVKTDDQHLMDIGTDHLIHLIQTQQDALIQANQDLTIAKTDVAKAKADAADAQSKLATTTQTLIQLQQMAVQSSQAQAQSASSNSEMKTMLVQITQAMATLQAGNTKTTE